MLFPANSYGFETTLSTPATAKMQRRNGSGAADFLRNLHQPFAQGLHSTCAIVKLNIQEEYSAAARHAPCAPGSPRMTHLEPEQTAGQTVPKHDPEVRPILT